jgi:hypothetical protein
MNVESAAGVSAVYISSIHSDFVHEDGENVTETSEILFTYIV